MAYSTPAMVRQALVASSTGDVPNPPSNTAADLSDAKLQDAIAEADSLIDGYIGAYYAVPVAPVQGDTLPPHPIDYWSRNLAAYNATLTYRGSLDFPDTDPVARRYRETMLALHAVSDGHMALQLPQNTGPDAHTGAGAVFNPYVGDLFTPDDFSLGTTPNNPGPYWWGRGF